MINRKKLLPLQPFVVPLNGLTQGGTGFSWHAGSSFFGNFEGSDILDADLSVEVHVEKSSHFIGVDCRIDGTVKVLCDRCLEDLQLPVSTGFALSVKFGEESGRAETDDREIVMLPEGETELDLSQFVYDYVCTSLPMRRVHPDGECNPETVKYLNREETERQDSSGSPFAGLKNLLK